MTIEELFWRLRDRSEETARIHGLAQDTVRVSARALSPEEAIGNPEHDDYPLIIDRALPTVFYGVTIAASAAVLGLNRYCPAALEAH
jgi:hypothetical protein